MIIIVKNTPEIHRKGDVFKCFYESSDLLQILLRFCLESYFIFASNEISYCNKQRTWSER